MTGHGRIRSFRMRVDAGGALAQLELTFMLEYLRSGVQFWRSPIRRRLVIFYFR
jgi:hypothetical protein